MKKVLALAVAALLAGCGIAESVGLSPKWGGPSGLTQAEVADQPRYLACMRHEHAIYKATGRFDPEHSAAMCTCKFMQFVSAIDTPTTQGLEDAAGKVAYPVFDTMCSDGDIHDMGDPHLIEGMEIYQKVPMHSRWRAEDPSGSLQRELNVQVRQERSAPVEAPPKPTLPKPVGELARRVTEDPNKFARVDHFVSRSHLDAAYPSKQAGVMWLTEQVNVGSKADVTLFALVRSCVKESHDLDGLPLYNCRLSDNGIIVLTVRDSSLQLDKIGEQFFIIGIMTKVENTVVTLV